MSNAKKYFEMITSYMVNNKSDFIFLDNHGLLTRCIDCQFFELSEDHHGCSAGIIKDADIDDYCSKALRKN